MTSRGDDSCENLAGTCLVIIPCNAVQCLHQMDQYLCDKLAGEGKNLVVIPCKAVHRYIQCDDTGKNLEENIHIFFNFPYLEMFNV